MPASAENFVAAEPTPAEPKSRSNGSKFSVSSNVAPAKEYPSLKELSDSLPPSVFQSSLTRAMLYVAFDTAVIIGLCAVQYFSFHQSPYFWHAYPVYAFLQGTIMWAYFVLGHDCGHGSFSQYELVNDIVGTLLHTFILVPFYPWKLSHRHHHQYTGNIDKEEVFYPIRRHDWETQSTTGGRLAKTSSYFMLGLGWFSYLLVGYASRDEDTSPTHSHFSLRHRLFEKHQTGVAWSLFSWYLWASVVALTAHLYLGWANVALYYLVPVFVFASWLTVVTFLHHHEPDADLPWFGDKVWNYVKGNLSSIDRSYGIFHWLTHNIGTHQIHHLFPKIPQYKLVEATAAFRAKFPELARESDRNIIAAFVKSYDAFAQQLVIDDDVVYHLYRPAGSLNAKSD